MRLAELVAGYAFQHIRASLMTEECQIKSRILSRGIRALTPMGSLVEIVDGY
jgi:hypothetical protein